VLCEVLTLLAAEAHFLSAAYVQPPHHLGYASFHKPLGCLSTLSPVVSPALATVARSIIGCEFSTVIVILTIPSYQLWTLCSSTL
jgi:hypothetical protein